MKNEVYNFIMTHVLLTLNIKLAASQQMDKVEDAEKGLDGAILATCV